MWRHSGEIALTLTIIITYRAQVRKLRLLHQIPDRDGRARQVAAGRRILYPTRRWCLVQARLQRGARLGKLQVLHLLGLQLWRFFRQLLPLSVRLYRAARPVTCLPVSSPLATDSRVSLSEAFRRVFPCTCNPRHRGRPRRRGRRSRTHWT